MTRGLLVALGAVLVLPAASRAGDLAPLYPDAASFAFGLDVKAITSSPLGRKVVGNDKPFDATRKLLKVLFPNDVFPITDTALRPLETVTNQLERVTIVGSAKAGNWPPPIAVYLEGAIDEEEYFKAAEGVAKQESKQFKAEKLGNRRLLVVGTDTTAVYGLRVSKSLFVIVTARDLIDEVLDKHAGKRPVKVQKSFDEVMSKVKPVDTPIWLVVGETEVLGGITGIATIGLTNNADFRMEVACDIERTAKTLAEALEWLIKYLARAETPQGKLWHAARITMNRDGNTIVATGCIPGKLLAEEYARHK